jgi:acetolactate synthase-1/2/3 large subunit
MKLSDYVVQFLVDHGVPDIFLVSGGGIMHLCDSVGRNRDMTYWCNYHEQACAIAAEAYARVRNGVGACLVTTGPGGANAVSGLAGAWADSIPVFAVCGQVRSDLVADYSRIRQFGPQEGNITAMAAPVTKYARTVTDPSHIRRVLEQAWHLATTGRPGPVLVEVPLDVQGSQVDETALDPFRPSDQPDSPDLSGLVSSVLRLIAASRRPMVVAGNGIHLSGSEPLLLEFLAAASIPVVVPYTGKDLVPEAEPMNMGVFGTAGQRRANFAVQNSDLIVAIGAGLCCAKVGFNFAGFAPRAKKVLVDIDDGQLTVQAVKPDLAVRADARRFLEELLRQWKGVRYEPSPRWLAACARWKERYPQVTPDFFADPDHVNSYVFFDRLAGLMAGNDALVTGNGLDCVSFYQGFKIKAGQRAFLNGNWGAMGWDLPAAVGACVGSGKRRTVCVTGDGSMQLNVQELLTISHYGLPVKVFVFNNSGYASIRATQKAFFDGHFVGAEPSSGVDNPDFAGLAAAYRLGYYHLANNESIVEVAGRVLAAPGPTLCEVNVSAEQAITPKASAFRRPDGTLESRPLEDMAPFLPRQEVYENMHQFDDGESAE